MDNCMFLFRKTQNEMLSDASIVPKIDVGKQAEEEEAPSDPSGQMSTTVYQTNHGQYSKSLSKWEVLGFERKRHIEPRI